MFIKSLIICYLCGKYVDMKISFELRSTAAVKKGVLKPLYIRLVDGRAFHQVARTRIMVDPAIWDGKNEMVKSRVLCPPEERSRIDCSVKEMREFIINAYGESKKKTVGSMDGWLSAAVTRFHFGESTGIHPSKVHFDVLYDSFLSDREIGIGRKRHYEVLRRMIHRYEYYVRISRGRRSYVFDVAKADRTVLEDLYDYIENEYSYVEIYPVIIETYPERREINPRGENYMSSVFKELRAFFNWCYRTGVINTFPFEGFRMPSERYGSPICLSADDIKAIWQTDLSKRPMLGIQRDIFVFQCNVGCRVGDLLRLKKHDVINGALEYIPSKTIKESAGTVVVPLNRMASEIVAKYADCPGDSLLPFISYEKYNYSIKKVLELAGVTYLVTELDPVTRKERKVPINEIASSHLARRTFIGNIYKTVKDPNLVSSLTGHAEGSRAFTRYRKIDIDMKRDLVNILDGGFSEDPQEGNG